METNPISTLVVHHSLYNWEQKPERRPLILTHYDFCDLGKMKLVWELGHIIPNVLVLKGEFYDKQYQMPFCNQWKSIESITFCWCYHKQLLPHLIKHNLWKGHGRDRIDCRVISNFYWDNLLVYSILVFLLLLRDTIAVILACSLIVHFYCQF